jgi:23S rRNA (cytidine1920-2'-O)/16S rRNA (cytidine1409-2'-O)-methyltransferase
VTRVRLDQLLVDRGLAPNRARAVRLIMAGDVLVDDRPATKPGSRVSAEVSLRLRGLPSPYVSRGGEKLAGALDAFAIDPTGMRVLDVGASTGGFTDCVLQRGAREVVAVDVGYGQLAWSLRQDPRVLVRERVNARMLPPDFVEPPVDLAVLDVSFISLRLVLPAIVPLVRPRGTLVPLVKPQFEVGPDRVGSGGVVRDEAARAEAVDSVRGAAEAVGLLVRGQADSVLAGPKGNREIFLWCERRSG